MSFTDNLLKQYADKRASKENYLNQFQGRQGTLEDTGFQGTAGTGIQMLNQGMANLLGAFNAGAVRANNNREELMKAEQLGYTRDQDAAKLEQDMLEQQLEERKAKDTADYQQGLLAEQRARTKLDAQKLAMEQANQNRLLRKENEVEELTRDFNKVRNQAFEAYGEFRDDNAKILDRINKDKISYTVGEDNRLIPAEGTSEEGVALIGILNERLGVNPTALVADSLKDLGVKWGSRIDMGNTVATLDQGIYSSSQSQASKVKEATEGKLASIQSDLDKSIKSLMDTRGFAEGGIGSSIINQDPSDKKEYDPNYVTQAIRNSGQFSDDIKPAVTDEIISIGSSYRDKLKKQGLFKIPTEDGGLTESQYWKVLGEVASTTGTSFWAFGDIKNSKLESRLKSALEEAQLANKTKAEITTLRNKANAAAGKAKLEAAVYGGLR